MSFHSLSILSVVVFFHELGHYLVGRWCGVKVDAFSLGFGPELFAWVDKHGTRWRLAAFPLGGYVKFHGDAGVASAPDTAALAGMAQPASAPDAWRPAGPQPRRDRRRRARSPISARHRDFHDLLRDLRPICADAAGRRRRSRQSGGSCRLQDGRSHQIGQRKSRSTVSRICIRPFRPAPACQWSSGSSAAGQDMTIVATPTIALVDLAAVRQAPHRPAWASRPPRIPPIAGSRPATCRAASPGA